MTAMLKGKSVNAQEMRRIAGDTMRAQFLILRRKGKARASSDEEFYGFRPEDVVEMYSRKHGVAKRGLWYRLKDGRVIDALGRPSEPDRAWYVAATH